MSTAARRNGVPSNAAETARRLSQRSTEETLRRLLAQLAAEPERLQALLADDSEPLMAFTAQRHILGASVALETLFGYERHALDGRSTDVLLPERLRQPDAPPMVATPDLTTVEIPGLRCDGVEVLLSWTFGSVPSPSGPIFLLVARDRRTLDVALEALQLSEERFRLLIDGVRDHAIFLLDADGRVATWNRGAERIKGWSTEEISGQHYEIFFTPDDRAAGVPAAHLAKARAEGLNEIAGWRVRKDGSRFWAEASLWALSSEDGAHLGFAKVTHDLTERRLAEENERRLAAERAAREAAEAGLRGLRQVHRAAVALSRAATPEDMAAVIASDCAPEVGAEGAAVFMLTDDGGGLRLIGLSGHPDGGIPRDAILPLDADRPACIAARTREPFFFESLAEVAARFPSIAGEVRASGFRAGVTLPLVARGALIGVLGFLYSRERTFDDADRSLHLTMSELSAQALERARLFAAERRARSDAEDASRAKDEFLAMLGHELRNPLAPISTAVQLMKLRNESLREREVIERQLRHLSTLVDDLLDVARIARGKLDLVKHTVEIADVLAKAVEMASPLLEQRGHELEIRAPSTGLQVDADPLRLAQVVSNLLTNAAKYTPPRGHVQLVAERERDEIVIRVRDDGEGISAELLPRVFDMFVQGKRTFDRSEGGLGLGLALVKNLVALHGGTVSASSAGRGAGSEFVVRLAAFSGGTAVRDAAEPRIVSSTPRKKRVLVVDDNRDAAVLLAEALTLLGYEAVVALDGHAALERLRDFPAEAAVLDLGLPVIDGFELARRIGESFASRRPRLIALTGYGQELDRERSSHAGFDAHLVKPIDVAAVVAALEQGG